MGKKIISEMVVASWTPNENRRFTVLFSELTTQIENLHGRFQDASVFAMELGKALANDGDLSAEEKKQLTTVAETAAKIALQQDPNHPAAASGRAQKSVDDAAASVTHWVPGYTTTQGTFHPVAAMDKIAAPAILRAGIAAKTRFDEMVAMAKRSANPHPLFSPEEWGALRAVADTKVTEYPGGGKPSLTVTFGPDGAKPQTLGADCRPEKPPEKPLERTWRLTDLLEAASKKLQISDHAIVQAKFLDSP